MKMSDSKQIYVFFILVFFTFYSCSSQHEILNEENLHEDLEYLNNAIKSGHPLTLNESGMDSLDLFIAGIKEEPVEEISAFDYEYKIREALAILGCTHTYVKASPLSDIYKNKIGTEAYFPFRCFADSSGLYLLESDGEKYGDSLNFPLKVVSINNLTGKDIIKKLIVYHPTDGHQRTMGYAIINKFSEVLIRSFFYNTNDFNIKYLRSDGKVGELKTFAIKEYQPKPFEYFSPESTTLVSQDDVELFQLNNNSMYLRLKSTDYDDFKTTNAALFKHIMNPQTEHLVIDLRGNGGGKPKSAFDLLSYILPDTLSQIDIHPKGKVSKYLNFKLKLFGVWWWDKITPYKKTTEGKIYTTNTTYPKTKRFKGKVYVLTDGFTASAACTIAAYLKHKAGAICIGQETAGGETGCNANSFQTLRLPNSKIEINFPLFRFKHELPIPDNRHGVIPDYPINYDAKNYLMNRDLEMEKVLEFIQDQRNID